MSILYRLVCGFQTVETRTHTQQQKMCCFFFEKHQTLRIYARQVEKSLIARAIVETRHGQRMGKNRVWMHLLNVKSDKAERYGKTHRMKRTIEQEREKGTDKKREKWWKKEKIVEKREKCWKEKKTLKKKTHTMFSTRERERARNKKKTIQRNSLTGVNWSVNDCARVKKVLFFSFGIM